MPDTATGFSLPHSALKAGNPGTFEFKSNPNSSGSIGIAFGLTDMSQLEARSLVEYLNKHDLKPEITTAPITINETTLTRIAIIELHGTDAATLRTLAEQALTKSGPERYINSHSGLRQR